MQPKDCCEQGNTQKHPTEALDTSLLQTYGFGSCATYSIQDIIVLRALSVNMSSPRFILRNPDNIGSSDDKDIDFIDLAPLISCHITPIVTEEDKAKDSRIPALESDE